MKHLFHIISNITKISAISVIENDNLLLEDCLQFVERGISPIEGVEEVDFQEINSLRASWGCLPTILSTRKSSEQKLKKITHGEEFFLYTSSLTWRVPCWLKNNALCKGFYYLEEGSLSYREAGLNFIGLNGNPSVNQGRLSFKFLKASFLHRLAFGGLNVFYSLAVDPDDPKYMGAYALTKKSFSGMPLRKLIEMKTDSQSLPAPEYKVDYLFILNNFELYHQLLSAYYGCLIRVLSDLGECPKEIVVHYKCHPSKESQVFELPPKVGNAKFVALPTDHCVEKIIERDRPAVFFFFSSVGIYAQHFSCETYSWVDTFFEKYTTLKELGVSSLMESVLVIEKKEDFYPFGFDPDDDKAFLASDILTHKPWEIRPMVK